MAFKRMGFTIALGAGRQEGLEVVLSLTRRLERASLGNPLGMNVCKHEHELISPTTNHRCCFSPVAGS
jgi:hypothetical protein